MDDMALLREYATRNSEAAFETLVSRRVNFVYSAALRQVHDPHLAEEVTQAVFIILAQKAGRISDKTILPGWLFKATRFAALAQIRAAARRRQYEQEAQMQSELQQTAAAEFWGQLSPLLDEALASLGETDRQAVLLRYFENQSMAEVGNRLGTGEDTARKRISRALEKLHRYFSKRGVSSTTAIIAGAISAHSVQAAPAMLAKSVTAAAIAKGAAASGSTLTLIKGALKIMAWTKAKTAIVVVVGILFVGTATVTVKKIKVYETDRDSWRSANLTWQQVGETPPQVRILPTKFKPPVKHMLTSDGTKWGGVRVSVREIVRAAYRGSPGRVIFPAGEPQEKYDFISTLSRGTEEALQRELKKTLGFVGRWETRETDALALKVRNPDATGLKPAFWMPDEFGDLGHGHIHCFGEGLSWTPPMPPWGLTKYLEMVFQIPVVDETGLTGSYNIDLRWKVKADQQANQDALKQALLDQLGLELVPTNMPIEMLVVEKVK